MSNFTACEPSARVSGASLLALQLIRRLAARIIFKLFFIDFLIIFVYSISMFAYSISMFAYSI